MRIAKSIIFILAALFIVAVSQDTYAKYTDNQGLTKKQIKAFAEDVHTIKQNIKKSKNLENNEKTITKYLKDTLYNTQHPQLIQLNAENKRAIYENSNIQLYLQKSTDTTKIIQQAGDMFRAYLQLDSLQMQILTAAQSNKDTQSVPATRAENAQFLTPFRKNLYVGAIFLLRHNKYAEAYKNLDLYLDCKNQPLFADLKYEDNPRAAFLALTAAVQLDSLPLALKYSTEAIQPAETRQSAMQMLAQISLVHNDTMRYNYYVQQGFSMYPDDTYFLLAHHNRLAMLGKDEEVIKTGLKIIEIEDTIPDPYLNIGRIYFQQAENIQNGKIAGMGNWNYKRRLQSAQKEYRKALPYVQKYRTLAPERKTLWYPMLYNIYLNLNMGKEFSELENTK